LTGQTRLRLSVYRLTLFLVPAAQRLQDGDGTVGRDQCHFTHGWL